MRVAVLAERDPNEGRVAATAETVKKLKALGAEVAVESGAARMAWIGEVDGAVLRPVAWGGPARAYTEGLVLRIDDPSPGPSACAVVQGTPQICNDVATDPRTAPWRDRATALGVRASGAFPIRRNGHVVATLNLYFAEPGAFDAGLVELVGQVTGSLGVALDRIERAAAGARAQRLARRHEQQLAGIVEHAFDAIVAVDVHQDVVLFNAAASRMFGVPREEAIGRPVDRFIPPPARAAHRLDVARYAAGGGVPRPMGHAREVLGLRAGGETFPMEASISRIGEGEDLVMIVTARDVTGLREAERANAGRASAEAANRAKTEFLSRMSHELRTPLNAVLGFAQLMAMDTVDPPSERHRRQLALVLHAGEHLRALVDHMLDLPAIEAGRLTVELADFELCALLDDVLHMSEAEARRYGVRLESAFSRTCPVWVHSDAARVRQILINLLSNAVKYNRPGGWVRLGAELRDGRVELTVADNGLGMTPAQVEQLYQPFNRLGREASAVPGTGIGLALARQLAGLLGSELAVQSRPDEGSTLRLALPAAPPRAATPPQAPADDARVHGCVLYVEDNPVNALLVEQLLARWPGVRTVVAADGAEGLARAAELLPDVLLLDMQLPDMGGLEVLRFLREAGRTRDLVVVALSASALPQEVEAARKAGAADFWSKPISAGPFIENMRRLLRSRPAGGEAAGEGPREGA